jgi:ABC-type multidrug transport system fused ATPase/permease subunit
MFKEIKIFFKFFNCLSPELKKSFSIIILSTILLGTLEMLSASMVIPIIVIMLDLRSEKLLSKITNSLGIENINNVNLILLAITIFFFIFIIRSIYSLWHSYYQSNYIYKIQQFIAERLYELRGFPSLQNNSSVSAEKLAHKIINETSQLSTRFSWPLSIIFSELCIVLGLLIVMFIFDFLAAIIFFSITFTSSALFYFFIRKKIKLWGEKYFSQEQERSDLVMRGINDGIQIELLGLKSFFFKIFNNYNQNISRLLTLQRTFLLSPRVFVELFSIIAILILTLTYFNLGKDNKIIIASITLITFLGMRAMPSLNKIAMSLQEFRFAKPLIESILIELQYNDETIQKYAVFRDKGPLYIAKGSINFNGKKKIDLCIESNASILVTGPSGCGKSTLLKSLMGLDKKLDEVSFYRELDKTIKIAFLTSSTPLFKMTLIENILLGREIKKQELFSIIDICRLQEFDLLGEGGQRIVEENNFKPSSGEIQRLILARALVQQPKFLLLDEALSAIDRENYFLIEKKLLTTFQGIFIHVSHYYSDPKNYTHFIEFK